MVYTICVRVALTTTILNMIIICRHHPYTSMLSYPSLRKTRVLRWVTLCFSLLTNLFVDALFFGILFPDDGSCERHSSIENCVDKIGLVTGTSICTWSWSRDHTDGGFCKLNPPSNSFDFILVSKCFIRCDVSYRSRESTLTISYDISPAIYRYCTT